MIPELAVLMLACTRIGAIHSIIFGGFSPEVLLEELMIVNQNMLLLLTKGKRW